MPIITPPIFLTSLIAASAVPPVARRSSTIKTLFPGSTASTWISKLSFPYSRSYETLSVFEGSFPGFLIGIKPTWSLYASALPKINPLASIPAI